MTYLGSGAGVKFEQGRFCNASTPFPTRQQKASVHWEGLGGKAPSHPGAKITNHNRSYNFKDIFIALKSPNKNIISSHTVLLVEKYLFFTELLMHILIAIQLFKFRGLFWLPRLMFANYQVYLFLRSRKRLFLANCSCREKKKYYISLGRNIDYKIKNKKT